MKKCFYSIFMCSKRAIINRWFLVAVVLTAVLFIMDLMPVFLSGITEFEGETYYSYSLVSLIQLSGMTMMLGFSFVSSSLPYSGAFCDDYETGTLISFMSRSTGMGYAVGTVTACGISSFLCTFISQCICLGFYKIFIPVSSGTEALDAQSGLLSEGRFILFIFSMVTLWSLRAAFFAIVALALSTIAKNKYVVYSIPLILYFFFMKLGYGVLKVPGHLNVLGVYFGFALGDDREILSLLYSAAFTVIAEVIAGAVLLRKVRRCL